MRSIEIRQSKLDGRKETKLAQSVEIFDWDLGDSIIAASARVQTIGGMGFVFTTLITTQLQQFSNIVLNFDTMRKIIPPKAYTYLKGKGIVLDYMWELQKTKVTLSQINTIYHDVNLYGNCTLLAYINLHDSEKGLPFWRKQF